MFLLVLEDNTPVCHKHTNVAHLDYTRPYWIFTVHTTWPNYRSHYRH